MQGGARSYSWHRFISHEISYLNLKNNLNNFFYHQIFEEVFLEINSTAVFRHFNENNLLYVSRARIKDAKSEKTVTTVESRCLSQEFRKKSSSGIRVWVGTLEKFIKVQIRRKVHNEFDVVNLAKQNSAGYSMVVRFVFQQLV